MIKGESPFVRKGKGGGTWTKETSHLKAVPLRKLTLLFLPSNTYKYFLAKDSIGNVIKLRKKPQLTKGKVLNCYHLYHAQVEGRGDEEVSLWFNLSHLELSIMMDQGGCSFLGKEIKFLTAEIDRLKNYSCSEASADLEKLRKKI